jgi:hypothetical protein
MAITKWSIPFSGKMASFRPPAHEAAYRRAGFIAPCLPTKTDKLQLVAFNIGTVGSDFQVAGFGPFHAAGASDMILRNKSTGEFFVYDIVNNQITTANSLGAVGLDWQLGGFAANAPGAAMGSSDGSTSQLVQAMAGFDGGGGATDSLNAVPLGADTSQQPLLTTPHA